MGREVLLSKEQRRKTRSFCFLNHHFTLFVSFQAKIAFSLNCARARVRQKSAQGFRQLIFGVVVVLGGQVQKCQNNVSVALTLT